MLLLVNFKYLLYSSSRRLPSNLSLVRSIFVAPLAGVHFLLLLHFLHIPSLFFSFFPATIIYL